MQTSPFAGDDWIVGTAKLLILREPIVQITRVLGTVLASNEELYEEFSAKMIEGSGQKRKAASLATRGLSSTYILVGASGLEPLTPTV